MEPKGDTDMQWRSQGLREIGTPSLTRLHGHDYIIYFANSWTGCPQLMKNASNVQTSTPNLENFPGRCFRSQFLVWDTAPLPRLHIANPPLWTAGLPLGTDIDKVRGPRIITAVLTYWRYRAAGDSEVKLTWARPRIARCRRTADECFASCWSEPKMTCCLAVSSSR